MGLDPRLLPDRFKILMADQDKKSELKRSGLKALQTTAQASLREALRLERADHSDFSNYLLQKGIEFEHDDPTQRSTNRRGWPDFRCFTGPPPRTLFVEFKKGANRLTAEQEEIRRYLEGCGYRYVVVYSLSEAIEAVHQHLLKNK